MILPTLMFTASFDEDFSRLTQAVLELDFDGVLYSFYPRPMYLNQKVQPILHYSEAFAPFVSHYLENNYGNCDFVLRLALENGQPIIDWWQEINKGNVSAQERAVTEDAKRHFGIHHGLSIATLSGSFAIAGVSVISKNESTSHFESIKKRHQDKLNELAQSYHSKMMNSKEELRFFIKPLLESLNKTQKKVLSHLLTGKPMKSIPDTCDITQKYAEKVLVNIRKEFGNISTYELIYLLGMVNMHESL